MGIGESNSTVLRSARTVSILTLVSRVLGFVRDAFTVALLGNSWVNDVLVYAWTVPNAFRRLFGEGALGSAFVPVFTRVHEQHGIARARQVANQVVSALAVVLLALAGMLMLATALVPASAVAAAFGMAQVEQAELLLQLLAVLLPYLVVICVIAQFMGMMNALGRFGPPAIAPILLNVIWIIAAIVAGQTLDNAPDQARLLGGAILLAAAVQLLWHLPFLRALGVAFRPVRPRLTSELREVGRLMGPMLLGMGAAQINVLVDRSVAMRWLPDGGTTHVYLGLRIMQFPLGLVAIALGTAVYPTLVRLATRRDRAGTAATADLALRTHLLVSFPAAAGLVLLATPIVRVLFERGSFSALGTEHTADALVGYALGIPFAGLVVLLNRVCYATGDLTSPMRVGLSLVLVNAALDVVLVGPLGELGLGLATSITALLTALLLLVGLRRRVGLALGAPLLAGLGRVGVVTSVMVLVVWLADAGVIALAEGAGPHLLAGLRLSVGIAVGLTSYLLGARRLCPREWGEVSSALSRRSAEA